MGTVSWPAALQIDFGKLTNSSLSINLLSAIARIMPRRAGHRLADFIAKGIAGQKRSRLTRAMRANQWVIRGGNLTSEALDSAVLEALRNSARSIFDLYHLVNSPRETSRLIVMDDTLQRLVRRQEFEREGLMLVGIHLSIFDLVLRWFSMQGVRPLVLTVPEIRGGRQTEYEMRRHAGMRLIPGTIAGLRHTLRHLQRGGVVLTGVDRPVPEPHLYPLFFGRPAALPVHQFVLAMRARVPVGIVAGVLESDGRYHIHVSEFVPMSGDARNEQDVLLNAERVLRIAEAYIRRAPEQWSVPLPVWPSTMELIPN